MSDKVPYNRERESFLGQEIRRQKHIGYARFSKFEKEHKHFMDLFAVGYLRIDYLELRKQWNKVNDHLIRLHNIESEIHQMYAELHEMGSF